MVLVVISFVFVHECVGTILEVTTSLNTFGLLCCLLGRDVWKFLWEITGSAQGWLKCLKKLI